MALAIQLCIDAPMREKKNDEKGYFFRAGQCAALSSFRVEKCYFCRKRVNVFLKNITNGCRSKRVWVLIYYIKRVTF